MLVLNISNVAKFKICQYVLWSDSPYFLLTKVSCYTIVHYSTSVPAACKKKVCGYALIFQFLMGHSHQLMHSDVFGIFSLFVFLGLMCSIVYVVVCNLCTFVSIDCSVYSDIPMT